MEGDLQGRIGLADRRHHLVGARLQAAEIDGEMPEPARKAVLQDLMRALAHRRGGQEAAGGLRVRRKVRLVRHTGLRCSPMEKPIA
jgi:hypothetical protein